MSSNLEMDYETIFAVIDSWEGLRRLNDYELVAGTALFKRQERVAHAMLSIPFTFG